MLEEVYIIVCAESRYDSPGAWREIVFLFLVHLSAFGFLLLLVSGRASHGWGIECRGSGVEGEIDEFMGASVVRAGGGSWEVKSIDHTLALPCR